MAIYDIGAQADQLVYSSPEWKRRIFAKVSCHNCGYLHNSSRHRPIDLVIDPTFADDSAAQITAPLCPVIGAIGCKVVRRDLADDLDLNGNGGLIGQVLIDGTPLEDYYSVVFRHDCWIAGFYRPLHWMSSCEHCNRVIMNASPNEIVVIRESLSGNRISNRPSPSDFDVYSLNGLQPLITDRAVERIRPSILKELRLTAIKLISVNELHASESGSG